jgi:glycosyltransferase involved in cell wall biosynthesis
MKLIRITTVPMSLRYLLHGQLSFMKAQGFEVLAVSADGKERDEIQQEGIAHVIIPFTRKITLFKDVVCLVALIRLFIRERPDIVHTHTPKAGLLGMLAARMCRVKVRLHTVAGLPMTEAKGMKRLLLATTERITYACATRVYPNSAALFSYIIRKFNMAGGRWPVSGAEIEANESNLTNSQPLINSKFRIIGRGSSNGIDLQYYFRTDELMRRAREIRNSNAIPEDAIVFGFVGRVVKDKGIGELIQAFNALCNERRNVYLLLVGPFEDELDPLLPEDKKFLLTHPRVIMPGFQPDVRPFILASDIFVLPSYREGFPNVVMQAACLEVPCIVSDINGCNEIIEGEVSGLVVPAKNQQALYIAMKRLSSDKILRSRMAERAREFVSAHFDQRIFWNELLEEYRSLMGRAISH